MTFTTVVALASVQICGNCSRNGCLTRAAATDGECDDVAATHKLRVVGAFDSRYCRRSCREDGEDILVEEHLGM